MMKFGFLNFEFFSLSIIFCYFNDIKFLVCFNSIYSIFICSKLMSIYMLYKKNVMHVIVWSIFNFIFIEKLHY